jgi:ABC-type branched-subunit amino acid transport system permease subunit
MSSIPAQAPIPMLSLLQMQRFPRTVVVLTVALLFGGGGLMMHAESQAQVLGLLAGFIVVFALADRTAFGREVSAICSDYGGFANTTAFVCALAVVTAFHNEHYTLLMLSTVALFATACIGLNLQLAFAGIANFAGAAFFVIGSYTAAVLTAYAALPHLLILAVGGIVAGAVGVILLLPVLRTRGHYAALVTIAFGLLLRSLLEVNDSFGGPQGMKIKGFSLFGFNFNRVSSLGSWDVSFYLPYAVLAIGLFAVAFTLMRRIERSWIGIALDTVRSDESAASVFGLSIARWKVVAFLIGNMVIGVAGALYGMMNGFVTPNGAGLGDSLLMLSIIVLGGLGNFWGAVVAAMVILVIPEKLQAIQEYRLLIFALLVLCILLFRPSGILPRPLRDLSRFAGQSGERP